MQVTISRVQDNVATAMHTLDPGVSLTRGLTRGIPAYPRQATLTIEPVLGKGILAYPRKATTAGPGLGRGIPADPSY